jgi:hypothetical protein
MYKRWKAVSGTRTLENALEDKKNAKCLGQYRFGENAVYFQEGYYLCYSEIDNMEVGLELLSGKAGKGMKVWSPAAMLMVREEKYPLLASTKKQAQEMIDLIKIMRLADAVKQEEMNGNG